MEVFIPAPNKKTTPLDNPLRRAGDCRTAGVDARNGLTTRVVHGDPTLHLGHKIQTLASRIVTKSKHTIPHGYLHDRKVAKIGRLTRSASLDCFGYDRVRDGNGRAVRPLARRLLEQFVGGLDVLRVDADVPGGRRERRMAGDLLDGANWSPEPVQAADGRPAQIMQADRLVPGRWLKLRLVGGPPPA